MNMKNGDSCLFETKVDFCVVVSKGILVEVDLFSRSIRTASCSCLVPFRFWFMYA